MMGLLKKIKRYLKYIIIERTKTLTFHVEVIYNDKFWELIKKFVLSGKSAIWYLLTPVNYDLVKAQFGCNLSKKSYEKILLKRYKWLKEHGQEIQLHVHFRLIPEIYNSEKEMIKDFDKKISDGLKWMKKNGFEVNKVAFGWFLFHESLIEIAKKYNLEIVKVYDYPMIHDYELIYRK